MRPPPHGSATGGRYAALLTSGEGLGAAAAAGAAALETCSPVVAEAGVVSLQRYRHSRFEALLTLRSAPLNKSWPFQTFLPQARRFGNSLTLLIEIQHKKLTEHSNYIV